MGRPRKEDTESKAKIELKKCPRCESPSTGGVKDIHGFWRCNCSACGFWDCVVHSTAEEAEASWQAAGGPASIF